MKNLFEKGLYFAPDKGAAGGGKEDEDEEISSKGKDDKKEGGDRKTMPTFEEWFGGQNDAVKGLVEGHVAGLKTALGSEREARGTAEKGLRDVAEKLEKGSEAQKEVLKLAEDAAVGTTKVEFYEEAHTAGITNLKLAYHIAITEDLFDKKGNVDFDKMKEAYPQLFGKPPRRPKAGAGEGTGDDLGQKADMSDYIRRQAGRGRKT